MRHQQLGDFVVLVLSEAVLSETVLVLDGCLNCGDADRCSKRFRGTCGPMDRIAIMECVEDEYRPPPRTEKRIPLLGNHKRKLGVRS